VAVTLPRKVVQSLRRQHSDLGWAIVTLVERTRQVDPKRVADHDVQLVEVGDGQFLIAIDSALVHGWKGVQVVPLSATQSFLALDHGRSMSDLEVSVSDRLEALKGPSRERRALEQLAEHLRKWRRDPTVQSESRSIILVTKR